MFKDFCASGLILIALASQSSAADDVLYCSVEQTVGFIKSDEFWKPTHSNGSSGDRWIVKFENDYSKLTGIDGTETPYFCGSTFPNKAPDILTCVNSKVATMVFNYSTENRHFVMVMTSSGGWLGVGTEREKPEPFTDHLMIGKCQAF